MVNRIIFSGSDAPELLKQCSRDAPAMGEAAWRPLDAEVDEMEARLPKALARLPEARQVNFTGLLVKWQRQYVGIARGGRRLIYGNYFTIDHTDEFGEWRKRPMIVCDGGPSSFGAEYDVAARRITRIDFNGDFGTRQEASSYRSSGSNSPHP